MLRGAQPSPRWAAHTREAPGYQSPGHLVPAKNRAAGASGIESVTLARGWIVAHFGDATCTPPLTRDAPRPRRVVLRASCGSHHMELSHGAVTRGAPWGAAVARGVTPIPGRNSAGIGAMPRWNAGTRLRAQSTASPARGRYLSQCFDGAWRRLSRLPALETARAGLPLARPRHASNARVARAFPWRRFSTRAGDYGAPALPCAVARPPCRVPHRLSAFHRLGGTRLSRRTLELARSPIRA